MSMKLNIQKWGNSAAVRLPASMLAQLGVKVGDAFEVDVSPDAATLRVARPRYKLEDMLAQCSKKARPPKDMAAWDAMVPIGREIV